MRLVVAPLEPPDALIDHRQEIGDAIGDRGVCRDRASFRMPPHQAGFGALERPFRIRDDITQDVEFVRHRRASTEDDLG